MLNDIKLMYKNFIDWRTANNVENVLERFKSEDFAELKNHYHHGWHGVDKLGRPIFLERVGLFDAD